jgi:hypothetical protein
LHGKQKHETARFLSLHCGPSGHSRTPRVLGAKEAAGDLSGDSDLKKEGKVDRAAGGTKEAVGDAADKVKDTLSGDK